MLYKYRIEIHQINSLTYHLLQLKRLLYLNSRNFFEIFAKIVVIMLFRLFLSYFLDRLKEHDRLRRPIIVVHSSYHWFPRKYTFPHFHLSFSLQLSQTLSISGVSSMSSTLSRIKWIGWPRYGTKTSTFTYTRTFIDIDLRFDYIVER